MRWRVNPACSIQLQSEFGYAVTRFTYADGVRYCAYLPGGEVIDCCDAADEARILCDDDFNSNKEGE